MAVVHNGAPACAAPSGRPGCVVGTVTALRRGKGVDVLLAAAPRILEAVPGASIEDRRRADRRGPRFAPPPIRACGSRPIGRRAANHLRELDVYVLASSWEAFPIGVLEAIACGVPQVVTAVGGTREAASRPACWSRRAIRPRSPRP